MFRNLFCLSSGEGGQEQVIAGQGHNNNNNNDDDGGNGGGLPQVMNGRGAVVNNNDGGIAPMINALQGIDREAGVAPASSGRGMLDEVVVSALKNLNFQDQQRQLNEQHGIQENFEQRPEFIANKLNELEAQLNTQLRTIMMGVPFPWAVSVPDSPPGILLARAMEPNFMQNTYHLRLRVLRAEFYDAAKAAARMIRYFDLKKAVFGPERVCKKITYEDLSEDDVEALNRGFLQYMQGRDTVGRRVFVLFPHLFEVIDPKSMARLFLYYDTFVNENEYDKGYIFLGIRIGAPSKDALDMQNRVIWLKESLLGYPDSPSAIHACFFSNDTFHIVTKTVFLLMPPEVRAKIKIHVGSQTEWTYELMGYGINQHLVPLSSSGEIKLRHHHAFIEYRKELEKRCAMDPSYTPIEIPNNDDVLFGRGRTFRHHKGNQRLYFLIDENASRYDTCKNGKEKHKVIAEVIQKVKAIRGARFLTQDKAMLWIEVDDVKAKDKLGQMFRNVRKKSVAATSATTTKIYKNTMSGRTESPFSDGSDGEGVRKKKLDRDDQGASIAQDDTDSHDSSSIKRPRWPTNTGGTVHDAKENE